MLETSCRAGKSERNDKNNDVSQETCFHNSLYEKRIWTIDEVCLITGYKKGTIYNLVSDGIIPYRKPRKKLVFIPGEIMKWFKGE